ncbi:MAG TPA: kelch repeat-containing protein [Mycobacterium sp.]
MFGGYNDLYNATYDEVYVLSVPGFVWFKANYTAQTPRDHATCAVVGRRQMLSVGGVRSGLAWPAIGADRDPWPQGIGVFDLSALVWKTGYEPDAAPYDSPPAVKAWYNQGLVHGCAFLVERC